MISLKNKNIFIAGGSGYLGSVLCEEILKLEGNIFLGLTGIPDLKTPLANIWFALAEPEPFTFANFITKSFTDLILLMNIPLLLDTENSAYPMHRSDIFQRIIHNVNKHLHL